MIELNKFHNIDCMDYMKDVPDKYFDLAIVDPEFGIGISKSPRLVIDKGLKAKEWDNQTIDIKYFDELFHISKNQIIWGGNYYNIGICKHCLIWDKLQPEKLSFGMFDYAWTSFNKSNKIFRHPVNTNEKRIHECQKPIQLYQWLLQNYAKPGDKIFDSHVGSASSLIACHLEGFEYVGCEKDYDYYKEAKQRLEAYTAQRSLFDG